jgi:hypothetical protein
MPYRASGKAVMVKKDGRWVLLKRHKTEVQARSHAAALNANVRK